MMEVQNLLRAEKELQSLQLPPSILNLLNNFRASGFSFEIIPADGDFSGYIGYVLKNKDILKNEFCYVKEALQKRESWGEILIIKNDQNKIVGTLGPNRIEKGEQGKARARPGYFSVLPQYRNKGIGTVLFWTGMERMANMGASYIKISVEKSNLSAIKVYQNCGMKLTDRND
jgi:ribosomal protein S18 acetylase RimI-like enzyme